MNRFEWNGKECVTLSAAEQGRLAAENIRRLQKFRAEQALDEWRATARPIDVLLTSTPQAGELAAGVNHEHVSTDQKRIAKR
jgi:hypothetical protein